jgi:hypothetical protein
MQRSLERLQLDYVDLYGIMLVFDLFLVMGDITNAVMGYLSYLLHNPYVTPTTEDLQNAWKGV